jgi:mRNA interferase ChpB
MAKVFERGDIIGVCLNPVSGKELQGEFRPALVLSEVIFNRLGLIIIAPITQGGDFSRFAGFAVNLTSSGTETQGVVLVNMVRSIDPVARSGRLLEKAPKYIVDEVLSKLITIFEG